MLKPDQQLTVNDHRRDLAGMTYVYPVVSRRAGGVSIGVNLNPNNACNWRCVYCQVENLQRGSAPPLNLQQLEEELHFLLEQVVHGDFMQRHVPEGLRRLNDIALSGNGEPTTSSQLHAVIRLIGVQLQQFDLAGRIKVVLISNGSQMHKASVQEALRAMALLGGEVWFKLDRADSASIAEVNQTVLTPERALQQLRQSVACCPTWIQSCFFGWDGAEPSASVVDDYLQLLQRVRSENIPIAGVLLYGIARPSMQPEAPRLTRLSDEWMQALAQRIAEQGHTVRVSP